MRESWREVLKGERWWRRGTYAYEGPDLVVCENEALEAGESG